MTVVTRFAPSPTGFLHIGGARTALFSWLYARHTGGKFLLRIEDTDRERSTQAAVDAIHDGLTWLGLTSDEPVLLQSTRADRHREIAHELVARGAAYLCPVTPQELADRREAAELLRQKKEADGGLSEEDGARLEELTRPFRSPWRDPAKPLPDGAPTVVRLRMPDEGEIVVEDKVQGTVKIRAQDLDDLVLLRSDGDPTYMLAVVVDDHDMGVTHVIRGDDHLTNTFRQAPIFMGMGWDVPTYAHIPLIHGPDGKKLSKRHGAQGVNEYRDMGYLPEGLKNYLLRLGWSHGDDELIPEEQAIAWFDLDGLGKAPARLDFAKLDAVNQHYMAQAEPGRLLGLLRERPETSGYSDDAWQRVGEALPHLRARAAHIPALAEACRFLTDLRPIRLEGKQAAMMTDEAKGQISDISGRLAALPDWTESALKEELARYCADVGVGLGKIGPILRAALTGGAPSPDISLVLALLGRNECLARLADQTGLG